MATVSLALHHVAKTVLRAHELREASYQRGTFRYGLRHDEASEKALDEAGISDPAARKLVSYLHLTGEGIDLCDEMIRATK